MSYFFKRLTETVTTAANNVASQVKSVSDSLSLDNLQTQYGDPDGKKALYSGLDLTYVSPRIIAMGFPSTPDTKIRSRNDAAAVSSFLHEKHGGHFMVWNLAEESYDYGLFDNQVLEVRFPGQPAPPLGLLVRLCASIDNWLQSDARNVAAVHCMTGRGRTAVVCACAMAWSGLADSPMEALQSISETRKLELDVMCVPSQIRYVQYFGMLMEGVKPRAHGAGLALGGTAKSTSSASTASAAGLVLRRVILNGVPDMTKSVEEFYETRKIQQQQQAAAAAVSPASDDDGGDDERRSTTARDALSTLLPAHVPAPLAAAAHSAATKFGQFTTMIESAISGDQHPQSLTSATGGDGSGGAPSTSSATSMLGTVFAKIEEVSDRADAALDAAIFAVQQGVEGVIDTAARAVSNTGTGGVPGGVDADGTAPSSEGVAGQSQQMIAPDGTVVIVPAGMSAKAAAGDDVTGAGALTAGARDSQASSRSGGCRPYLQLFRGGSLVYSSTWQQQQQTDADSASGARQQRDGDDSTGSGLRWYSPAEGSVRFAVDVPLSGDILVRCRHFGDGGGRESLFRAAFHTGYITGYVLRLSKRQLDVASTDPRMSSDFFVEFVFAPAALLVQQQQAALLSGAAGTPSAGLAAFDAADVGQATISYPTGDRASAASGAGNSGSTSDYDALLLGDSDASATFWSDIERRKKARHASMDASRKQQDIERQQEKARRDRERAGSSNGGSGVTSAASASTNADASATASTSATAASSSAAAGAGQLSFGGWSVPLTVPGSLSSLVSSGLATAKTLGKELASEVKETAKEAAAMSREAAASAAQAVNTAKAKVQGAVAVPPQSASSSAGSAAAGGAPASAATTAAPLQAKPSASTTTAAAPTAAAAAAAADLAELESLEQELATVTAPASSAAAAVPSSPTKASPAEAPSIAAAAPLTSSPQPANDTVTAASPAAPSPAPAASASDDIDELEKYLEGLGT